MTDALTTVAAVQVELGSTGSALSVDYLSTLISQASDAIESWCGRSFGIQQATEMYTVQPTSPVVVQNRPVVSVDALTVDGIAVADVIMDVDAGILQRPTSASSWGGSQISVTYTAGYVLPGSDGRTLPFDIERAAILFIKRIVFAKDRDPSLRSKGLSTMEEISYFAADPNNIAPDVASLLARHCDPYV